MGNSQITVLCANGNRKWTHHPGERGKSLDLNSSNALRQTCEVSKMKNCQTICFKQVVPGSLSDFYLHSFNNLHDQLYNHICLLKLLKVIAIYAILFFCLFFFASLTVPTWNHYLLDFFFLAISSLSNRASSKQNFVTRHTCRCNSEPSWPNSWLQHHAKWQKDLLLMVSVYL